MEAASERIRAAVEGMLSDLDKTVSRPQQKETYKCCYDCCADERLSSQEVEGCINNCSARLRKTESIINTELQSFQARIQRCAVGCQEKVRDEVPLGQSELRPVQMSALQKKMEICINACADEQLKVLPKLLERIKYQAMQGR